MSVEPADQQRLLSLLLFQIGRETYAVASEHVREISRYRPYTAVPGAPPALPGVMSLRGAIVPVVEPRLLLGLPEQPLTCAARLVLVSYEEVLLALIVEAVSDLVDLPACDEQPAPGVLEPARAALIRGVVRYGDRPAALIDLGALINTLRSA